MTENLVKEKSFNLKLSVLTKNNLTAIQQKAIRYWTSPSSAKLYRDIKKASENKYLSTQHVIKENAMQWFEAIESLFTSFEDNSLHYKIIYRADIIENKTNVALTNLELFENFCKKNQKGLIFQFDDFLCSFTTCKDTSNDIMSKSDKYKDIKTPSVVFILEKRLSKYLYIADCTDMYEEKEVLCLGKHFFKITNQKIFENNSVKLTIKEVTD